MDLYCDKDAIDLGDKPRWSLNRLPPTTSGGEWVYVDVYYAAPTPPAFISLTEFIIPLTGVKKIMQSFVRMVYYASAEIPDCYGTINVKVIKSDASVRQTLGTNVSKTGVWTSAWHEYLGEVFLLPEYAVEDETDCLLVEVQVWVPTPASVPDTKINISFDDVDRAPQERTRLVGIVFASLKDVVLGIIRNKRLSASVLPQNLSPETYVGTEFEA